MVLLHGNVRPLPAVLPDGLLCELRLFLSVFLSPDRVTPGPLAHICSADLHQVPVSLRTTGLTSELN